MTIETYQVNMISYGDCDVRPVFVSMIQEQSKKSCNDMMAKDMHELFTGFNPRNMKCVQDTMQYIMQCYFILSFLKNRNLPLIEVRGYDYRIHVEDYVYSTNIRIHHPVQPTNFDALLQTALPSLEKLLNPPDSKLMWVYAVWSNILLRIFDAKTYEDQITNTYDLVQYLNSEEVDARSASSAGYLYGLSCVQKALESVLPEHTKYSNLELLISLVNKIRATNQSIFEIKSSKEFKLACDAVDEV